MHVVDANEFRLEFGQPFGANNYLGTAEGFFDA